MIVMLPSLTTCPRLSAATSEARAATASEGLNPAIQSRRDRRQRVVDVMRANQVQDGLFAATADHEIERGPFRSLGLDVFRPHVRRRAQAIKNYFAAKIAAKLRNVFVVGVQYRGSARWQRFNQFVFRACDARYRIKKLQMYGRDICYHANFGLRDFRQRGNLAGMRHPHLDYREVVFGLNFQQHEGKAKVIIEVAFGFQHSEAGRKHVRDGFFRGGLSRRSGHPDERLSPQPPNRTGQGLQRNQACRPP